MSSLCVPLGCLTGQWPFGAYCIHRRQQDLFPSELIKINLCVCAVCNTKEKWHEGAHHWRGRVKSLNEWGGRLFHSDRSINRNNEVTAGLGLFMWTRSALGPMDLWKNLLHPQAFIQRPDFISQLEHTGCSVASFPARERKQTSYSGQPRWRSRSSMALEY